MADDRETWVKAQADALYADLCAREAAEKTKEADQSTTVVNGDVHGQTGGVQHGGQSWHF